MNCSQPFEDPFWYIGTYTSICSGNGVCVSNVCVCNEGFTGLSDWINADGYNCQINILGFKVLWGVLLAIQVGCAIYAFPYLLSRREAFLKMRERKASRGERYQVWNNPGALGTMVWHAIGVPLFIVTCIVKLVMEEERIGVTTTISVLYLLVRVVFYSCVAILQPSLLAAVVFDKDSTATSLVNLNRHMTYGLLFLHVIAGCLPFIGIANEGLQQVGSVMNVSIMLLTAIFFVFQGYYIKKKISNTFDASYAMSPSEKTLKMKEKLRQFQNGPMKQGIVMVVVFLVSLIWSFLWIRQDYIFPITWIMYPVVGLKLARTSTRNRGDGSSSKTSSTPTSDSGEPADESNKVANVAPGSQYPSDVLRTFRNQNDSELSIMSDDSQYA